MAAAAAMLTCFCSLQTGLAQDAESYRKDIVLPIPKFEGAEIRIDGVLDEGVWSQANVAAGFQQYIPVDGRPAEDDTEVRLWYSDTALYVGIIATEIHGEVRSTLADRDKLDNDDRVLIVLDTYNDQRSGFAFIVNPIGQQADGTIRDQASVSGFGSRSSGEPFDVDENPDFHFTSRGQLTETGFIVEVEIPFKSLRFSNADVQDWGFNLLRKVQHSGYWSSWGGNRLGAASFMGQNGSLTGLTGLKRGRVLDINPEVRGAFRRGPEPAKFETDFTDPLGLNVHYGLSSNMVFNAALNPDFSQIEADVVQINYDPRRSVSYPEKRPFFLDGIELFSTPTQLIYTRSIVNPLAAAKVAGKVGATTVAALTAVDNAGPSIAEADAALTNAFRLKRDLGGLNSVGLVYTDRFHDDWYNRVIAIDGNIIARDRYSFTAQTGFSTTNDVDGVAPMWDIKAASTSRRWTNSISSNGYHPDFDPSVGFVSRGDHVSVILSTQRTFYGEEGDLLERASVSLRAWGGWDYLDFIHGRGMVDRRLYPTFSFRIRGGWSLTSFTWIETFGYPADFFTHYYLDSGSGFLPFTGEPELFNLGEMLSLSTPQFDKFSASLRYSFGRDPNYDEWADGDIRNFEVDLRLTPTDQIRLEFRYDHQQHFRATDNSLVSLSRVPRLKVEYQVTPTLFLRFVGQYRSLYKDALRDDSRTEYPIYFRSDDGTYMRATSRRSNNIQADVLLSYRPSPGTVFFLGYGSAMTERNTYRFQDLTRQSDGFFFKLSYLFRV
jgi:hypothetical protein